MAAVLPPIATAGAPPMGPVEMRVRSLADEIFDPADLTATLFTPILRARSASFIMLAHAEIEYAIEGECLRTANLLKNAADPATAMIAWGFMRVRDKSKPPKQAPLVQLAETYETLVQDGNHGIRENNLKTLLLPIGVDFAANRTDIQALHEFGGRRGLLAHNPLNLWPTTDLPTVHINSGTQAARSADQIISVIQTSHTTIHPRVDSHFQLSNRIRRSLGKTVRSLARKIDGRVQ